MNILVRTSNFRWFTHTNVLHFLADKRKHSIYHEFECKQTNFHPNWIGSAKINPKRNLAIRIQSMDSLVSINAMSVGRKLTVFLIFYQNIFQPNFAVVSIVLHVENQSVRTWLCVVLNVFKWWLSRISVDGLKCDICKDHIAHRLYQREVVSIELHLEYFHRIAFTQNVFEVNWKFMEIVSNLLYLNWMTKLFEMERFWYADGILACIWLHVILKICYCIWIETSKAIFEIVKVPTCSYNLVILIKVHSMQRLKRKLRNRRVRRSL